MWEKKRLQRRKKWKIKREQRSKKIVKAGDRLIKGGNAVNKETKKANNTQHLGLANFILFQMGFKEKVEVWAVEKPNLWGLGFNFKLGFSPFF